MLRNRYTNKERLKLMSLIVYTSVGATGAGGFSNATQNYLSNVGYGIRQNQYQSGTGQVSDYLNPSMAYTMDQANKSNSSICIS